MPKFLLINDIHLSDRPPAHRKPSYADDIFAKLYDCKQIAAIHACDYTILTGDVFHVPRANAVTHSLVSRTIAAFRDWPTPIYAIAGNHDLPEIGIEGLDRQPLFVLQQAGVINILNNDGFWANDGQTYVRMHGYDGNDLAKYSMKRPKGCRFYILVCHDMLAPAGNYPFSFICRDDIVSSLEYDAVFYGHVHWDMGATRVKGTYFVSAGSLSRVAKNDDNISRSMRVAIACVNDGVFSVEYAPLPSAKSSQEVFIDDSLHLQNQDEKFSEYVRTIASHNVEVVDLSDYLINLQIDPAIKEKVRYYLFEA